MRQATQSSAVQGELDRVSQTLTGRIRQLAERYTTPLPQLNLRRDGGGEYLEVVTPAYPSPISYRGHYYQRSGSTLQELKGAALDRFLLRKQGRTWDGVPVPNVAVKDLSGLAIKRFRTLAGRSGRVEPGTLREPAPALIDKLRLREGAHLKRAALLLFHQDPERFVNGAFVKIEFSARSPIWLTTTRCMEICSPKSQRRSSFCEPNTSRPPSATRASSARSGG